MAETFEPRRFNAEDWMGFGGAEKFKDGSEPLIIEAPKFVLVGDLSGIGYFDEETAGLGGWMLRATLTPMTADILMRGIAACMSRQIEAAEVPVRHGLAALGFEEC